MHDIAARARGGLNWPAASRPALSEPSDALLVAVPLFQSPHLVPDLVDALVATADELAALSATILFIIDSPGHDALDAALAEHLPRLRAVVPVELLRNPANLGFVRTANIALARGRDSDRDVILLNSDALPRPGAFAEMVAAAYLDPMIAAVSPRSDNATLCNSPYPAECRPPGDRARAYAAHRAIERHLPRITYVPTVVGFCMLVRRLMLHEFGLFDEAYGGGYNEENDFIRRCNRRGYRAVLANHAYAHHIGQVSFSGLSVPSDLREETNRTILDGRYPEYTALVRRFQDGAEFRAQRLLGGLVPQADGRLRLLFDCRILKPFFNGTHEHLCALVRAFCAGHGDTYAVHMLCDEAAFRFHDLHTIAGLHPCTRAQVEEQPFAAVVRLGQPFAGGDLAPLAGWAAVTGVLMLDTIAMDCQQLDEADLETLWQLLLDATDLLGFNSRFSQDQFNRRFAIPADTRQFVSRCSTEVRDYLPQRRVAAGSGILVVGNHFPHKHVEATVAALRARDRAVPITVLGIELGPEFDVRSVRAGDLPQAEVDRLYDEAALVLLPSHYEGFGLPILHALARGRPVVARDLPSAREIAERCPQAINLHLAASTEALVAVALDPPAWQAVDPAARSAEDWSTAADAIAEALADGIAGFRFATCRRRQARAVPSRPAETLAFAAFPATSAFMAGAELDDLPPPHDRLDPPGFEATRLSLSAGLAERTADPSALVLVADEAVRDGSDLQQQLLRCLQRVPLDAPLRLELPARLLGDDPGARALVAEAVLLGAGCRTDAVAAMVDGGVAVRAVRQADWRAALPGPDDNWQFVQWLYRHALGRDADSGGALNYLGEIASGRTREDVLRTFLSSPERHDMLVRRLRRARAGG